MAARIQQAKQKLVLSRTNTTPRTSQTAPPLTQEVTDDRDLRARGGKIRFAREELARKLSNLSNIERKVALKRKSLTRRIREAASDGDQSELARARAELARQDQRVAYARAEVERVRALLSERREGLSPEQISRARALQPRDYNEGRGVGTREELAGQRAGQRVAYVRSREERAMEAGANVNLAYSIPGVNVETEGSQSFARAETWVVGGYTRAPEEDRTGIRYSVAPNASYVPGIISGIRESGGEEEGRRLREDRTVLAPYVSRVGSYLAASSLAFAEDERYDSLREKRFVGGVTEFVTRESFALGVKLEEQPDTSVGEGVAGYYLGKGVAKVADNVVLQPLAYKYGPGVAGVVSGVGQAGLVVGGTAYLATQPSGTLGRSAPGIVGFGGGFGRTFLGGRVTNVQVSNVRAFRSTRPSLIAGDYASAAGRSVARVSFERYGLRETARLTQDVTFTGSRLRGDVFSGRLRVESQLRGGGLDKSGVRTFRGRARLSEGETAFGLRGGRDTLVGGARSVEVAPGRWSIDAFGATFRGRAVSVLDEQSLGVLFGERASLTRAPFVAQRLPSARGVRVANPENLVFSRGIVEVSSRTPPGVRQPDFVNEGFLLSKSDPVLGRFEVPRVGRRGQVAIRRAPARSRGVYDSVFDPVNTPAVPSGSGLSGSSFSGSLGSIGPVLPSVRGLNIGFLGGGVLGGFTARPSGIVSPEPLPRSDSGLGVVPDNAPLPWSGSSSLVEPVPDSSGLTGTGSGTDYDTVFGGGTDGLPDVVPPSPPPEVPGLGVPAFIGGGFVGGSLFGRGRVQYSSRSRIAYTVGLEEIEGLPRRGNIVTGLPPGGLFGFESRRSPVKRRSARTRRNKRKTRRRKR